MNNIKWPKTMPILNGNDMYHGGFDSPCGRRHCLIGHGMLIGSKTDRSVEGAIYESVRDAINEATGIRRTRTIPIDLFNDNHKLSTNAKIWNRAMYLLGYTEGNPQSKPVVIKKATK